MLILSYFLLSFGAGSFYPTGVSTRVYMDFLQIMVSFLSCSAWNVYGRITCSLGVTNRDINNIIASVF